ncbi:14684_t:CDS:1, partial [Racocetra persica]
ISVVPVRITGTGRNTGLKFKDMTVLVSVGYSPKSSFKNWTGLD